MQKLISLILSILILLFAWRFPSHPDIPDPGETDTASETTTETESASDPESATESAEETDSETGTETRVLPCRRAGILILFLQFIPGSSIHCQL